MTMIHRLLVPIAFSSGVAPGAGREGNQGLLTYDGKGRPIIRGSALAGVLRHAWSQAETISSNDQETASWFGRPEDKEERKDKKASGTPSPLRVYDTVLTTGKQRIAARTHNARSRHTGAVLDGSLFEIDTLPPGTHGRLALVLTSTVEEKKDAKTFLAQLVGLINAGLISVGGHIARGIGVCSRAGAARLRSFDLTDTDSHAAWLDELYQGWDYSHPANEDLAGEAPPKSKVLRIKLRLRVPRGQDLLVGDGQGFDADIEPQKVINTKGEELYRLPGSSLRGLFRAWVSRLATRDGYPVADTVKRYQEARDKETTASISAHKGDDLAWNFKSDAERQQIIKRLEKDPESLAQEISCPVSRLFGSSFSAGRIRIDDALLAKNRGKEHFRKHVAIDRFSGGANEGFLFDSKVLYGAEFETTIVVRNPDEKEAEWIAKTLRAIDLGICRVGSSKAGGRLSLAAVPEATGAYAERFTALQPSEVNHG